MIKLKYVEGQPLNKIKNMESEIMQNLTKEQLNKYVSELTNMAEIVVFEKLMCEYN